MSTRAELEAELKETQELERYMNTLLDDRIRQCEHLEYTNAALTKRVAELERCMQEVGLLAFMRDATPGDITAHMPRVMDSYVQRIADLESQLEAKDKCVAELEAKQCAHEAELAVAHEFIADLQSQLAWTPVSAGLPTEPGYYLFTNKGHDVALYRQNRTLTNWKWETVQGVKRKDDAMKEAWSAFRRIELPKDGET